MKKRIWKKLNNWASHIKWIDFSYIYFRYRNYTMINPKVYYSNLSLARRVNSLDGVIVECGTWKGGMIVGISEILGKERSYYLFDSFEGLPEAKEIDGSGAINWQKKKDSKTYYDNCKAEYEEVLDLVEKKANLKNANVVKGWFDDSLPKYSKEINKIALLRLDGDWYDSTMVCLKNLFDKVVKGGIIIIDDYYTWDGCSKAVHDYLSSSKSNSRILCTREGVCYIKKQ